MPLFPFVSFLTLLLDSNHSNTHTTFTWWDGNWNQCLLHSTYAFVSAFIMINKQTKKNRYIFQLHHVYGGVIGCVNGPRAELSSPNCGYSWNASMGKLKSFWCLWIFPFYFFPFILYQLFRNTHCVLFLPIRNSNILRMRNLLSRESFFRFHHINYILNTQIQCVSKVFVVCAAQFQYTQFFSLLPLCFWLRRRFRTTRFEPYFCNGCHGYCECHDRVVKLLENQF